MRIAALVMAAGRASRFGADAGESKATAMLDGIPLVRRVAMVALASGTSPVVVVTGHAADAVTAALAGLKLRIAFNSLYEQGVASSLQHGLSHLQPDIDGVLVLLADMPMVTSETLKRLMVRFARDQSPPDAVVPVHGGVPGNPVLLGRRLFGAVATLRGDDGARRLLAEPARVVARCEVEDPGILVDVDTRAALDALRDRI